MNLGPQSEWGKGGGRHRVKKVQSEEVTGSHFPSNISQLLEPVPLEWAYTETRSEFSGTTTQEVSPIWRTGVRKEKQNKS